MFEKLVRLKPKVKLRPLIQDPLTLSTRLQCFKCNIQDKSSMNVPMCANYKFKLLLFTSFVNK